MMYNDFLCLIWWQYLPIQYNESNQMLPATFQHLRLSPQEMWNSDRTPLFGTLKSNKERNTAMCQSKSCNELTCLYVCTVCVCCMYYRTRMSIPSPPAASLSSVCSSREPSCPSSGIRSVTSSLFHNWLIFSLHFNYMYMYQSFYSLTWTSSICTFTEDQAFWKEGLRHAYCIPIMKKKRLNCRQIGWIC